MDNRGNIFRGPGFRRTAILGAGLLLAVPAALAQQQPNPAGQERPGQQNPGQQNLRQEPAGAPSEPTNVRDVVTAVNHAEGGVEALTQLPRIQKISIVALDPGTLDASLTSDVEAAVSDNEDAIRLLRNALRQNVPIADSLRDHGVDLSDVIAVNVDPDGELVVYTMKGTAPSAAPRQ